MIALPVDPSSMVAAVRTPSTATRARSDSLARLVAMRDSAAAVDRHFQSEREALNRESLSLDSAERRSVDYARRFDAFRRRALAAESSRSIRDRLRARAAPLAARFRGEITSTTGVTPLRSSIDTLSVAGRRAVIEQTRADTVRLQLADGVWWLGVASKGATPWFWSRVSVPAMTVVTLKR